MSKKTPIKKHTSKATKMVDKPAKVEAAPVAEPTTEPVVTTVQPVAAVMPCIEQVVRAPREQQNGVTRPRPGKCGDVWAVCDELLAAGKAISFEAIRAELPTRIADATIKTQRQRHRVFHGLGRKAA